MLLLTRISACRGGESETAERAVGDAAGSFVPYTTLVGATGDAGNDGGRGAAALKIGACRPGDPGAFK